MIKLFTRVKEALPRTPYRPPEGAHGQRNVDGSYFAVWLCPRGHGSIGKVETPPDRGCMPCAFDGVIDDTTPFAWRRATPTEARAEIFKIEGASMHNGIGFKLL